MNTFKFVHSQFSYFQFILSIIILCTGISTNGQDVIYKKDGTQITTYNLSVAYKNVYSYTLVNDAAKLNHYISQNVIDSIRYENGKLDVFLSTSIENKTESKETKLFKNSVGLNIWPLFYSKVNVYYERLFLKNKLGFKNHVLFNVGSYHNPYDNLNHTTEFYFSTGANYYFLRSYYFTMGIGGSFVVGEFNYINYDSYSYYYEEENSLQTGVFLNTSFSYVFENRVPVSLVLQVPLGFSDLNHPVFLETNIAINF